VIFFYVSSLFGDQCFWGRQLSSLGLGPAKALRVSMLSEATLVSQLREVLELPVREAARLFGSFGLVFLSHSEQNAQGKSSELKTEP
jgi:hypothetical protein